MSRKHVKQNETGEASAPLAEPRALRPLPLVGPPEAQQLAQRFNCTVVLKGSGTVIAAPGQVPVINPTGNARLATAGTGDVLAGMVGPRLAGGHNAFEAATQAVFEHGMAADRWPDSVPLVAGKLARQSQPLK